MELKAKFDIIYMREAIDFLEAMPEKARDKMAFNISKSRYFIDIELFKKLNDNIWEFRTRFQRITYRLLAFWDNETGNLVVATNGFIKKTQKTPDNEIAKAEALRNEYFNSKHQQLTK